MQPVEGLMGQRAFQSPWACLEDCGDCFEGVLAELQPADIAACRLVSRGWRREVSLLLQQLRPTAGVQPAAIAAAFPHLARLQLTASFGSPKLDGSSGGSTEGSSSGSSSSSSSSGRGRTRDGMLPPLAELPRLRRLRALRLEGLAVAGSVLDCAALLPLGASPAFDSLEATCVELRCAEALQQLGRLTRLQLQGYSLGDWRGTLPELLAPLRRMAHLSFSCSQARRPGGGGLVPTAPPGDSSGSSSTAGAGLLAGLGSLASLTSLELSCPDGASDSACAEVMRLPRLARLAIARCASFGQLAPSITDGGLEQLAASPLAGQLTSLCLTGHSGITNEGLHYVACMAGLRHLELRLGAPGLHGPQQAQATDGGLGALAALTTLESLHLGGACALGEAACTAFARRLRGLTSLQLSDLPGLEDAAVFRLAPLARGLRRLGLCGCSTVSDIALAALLRGAARLSHLELAGCHRNITGIGLQVASLRRLRHLNLAGCDAITDSEIEVLLPAARSLEHLDLRDCAVSDAACSLLAAHAPSLQWLSLEHCPRVSNSGLLHLASGLPRLSELRLFGSSVTEAAVAQLRRTPRGRRLRIGLHKHCWWLPPDAAGLAL